MVAVDDVCAGQGNGGVLPPECRQECRLFRRDCKAVPALTDSHAKPYSDARKEYLDAQGSLDLGDNELVLTETKDLADFDAQRVSNLARIQAEVGKALDPEVAPVAFRLTLSMRVRE